MLWDEETVAKLIKLWNTGHSASVCARVIGATTRESISGKIDRLRRSGVVLRSGDDTVPRASREQFTQARAKRIKRAKSAPTAKKPTPNNQKFVFGTGPRFRLVLPVDPAVVEPEIVIPVEQRKTLLMLEDGDCRWPIGTGPYEFCAAPKVLGSSYCEAHAQRSSASPTPMRAGPRAHAPAGRVLTVVGGVGAAKAESAASGQRRGSGDVSERAAEPETVD